MKINIFRSPEKIILHNHPNYERLSYKPKLPKYKLFLYSCKYITFLCNFILTYLYYTNKDTLPIAINTYKLGHLYI